MMIAELTYLSSNTDSRIILSPGGSNNGNIDRAKSNMCLPRLNARVRIILFWSVSDLYNIVDIGFREWHVDTISSEILADSEDSCEICHEAAQKQCDSVQRYDYR